MDRGEFQQDSVLKQLEVLKEEEKEFQNLKVGVAAVGLDYRDDGPIPYVNKAPQQAEWKGSRPAWGRVSLSKGEGLTVASLLAPTLRNRAKAGFLQFSSPTAL